MGVRENPNYAHLHLLSQEHGGGEGPNQHQRLGMLLREVEGHSGAWPGRAGGRDGARLLLGICFCRERQASVDTCVNKPRRGCEYSDWCSGGGMRADPPVARWCPRDLTLEPVRLPIPTAFMN